MENIVTVGHDTIVVGPTVSGELRPEREATVRAEIGGSVTQVNVREGQPIRRGTVLGRIETRTLDDVKQSAISSVRNAENQLAVATREMERTETLVKAGALAARDLDVAKQNVTSAEAQLADAKSRLASADRQLADTVLRAPDRWHPREQAGQHRRRGQRWQRTVRHHRPLIDAARGVGALGRPVAFFASVPRSISRSAGTRSHSKVESR
jgi:multidrug efflux pump subunit AcrA (membrane-fusion protein)